MILITITLFNVNDSTLLCSFCRTALYKMPECFINQFHLLKEFVRGYAISFFSSRLKFSQVEKVHRTSETLLRSQLTRLPIEINAMAK